jgi:HK97 family phage portal protein
MSWFGRLFGAGGLSNPTEGVQVSGKDTNSTKSGVALTDEKAMALSAVWSCVRLITETVGSLPLGVFERTQDGRESAEAHYLHSLLRESPNALMTPLEFREALTMQVALWGNGYAEIKRDNKGNPITLTPLHPGRVKPVREAGTVTYHYSTESGGHIYAKESILHLKGFGVEGIVGLSPLAYARETMGITQAADDYAASTYTTGARPSGVMTVDRILTTEQRDKLREIYEGLDANSLWVLEGGTGYQQMSLPPDDMQMLESRQFQLADIARFFRVPSHMINDTSNTTSWGSGIEQLNLGFLTYTLRPYLTRWESAVSHSLLSRTDRRKYFVEHNVEGLLRADSAARATFYSTMVQNGVYTRNEVRKKENLAPVDGADELTVQVNMAPVDELPGAVSSDD